MFAFGPFLFAIPSFFGSSCSPSHKILLSGSDTAKYAKIHLEISKKSGQFGFSLAAIFGGLIWSRNGRFYIFFCVYPKFAAREKS